MYKITWNFHTLTLRGWGGNKGFHTENKNPKIKNFLKSKMSNKL